MLQVVTICPLFQTNLNLLICENLFYWLKATLEGSEVWSLQNQFENWNTDC